MLSFIFLKFLNSFGFCLNLVVVKAVLDAQGRDWTGAFFQPIDFFFFLLMHMKRDPNYQITLSNQDDMQTSAHFEAV